MLVFFVLICFEWILKCTWNEFWVWDDFLIDWMWSIESERMFGFDLIEPERMFEKWIVYYRILPLIQKEKETGMKTVASLSTHTNICG